MIKKLWSWCVEAVKETLNLAWTLSGLAIATLTLTGQAQVLTFYATVITLVIWLITEKADGSFIQICNCKHGNSDCKEKNE